MSNQSLRHQPQGDILVNLEGLDPNERAFKPQCEAVSEHCSDPAQQVADDIMEAI